MKFSKKVGVVAISVLLVLACIGGALLLASAVCQMIIVINGG